MPNQNAEELIKLKKLKSPFVTLKDGESFEGLIMTIKTVITKGYNGDDDDVLQIKFQINIPEVGLVDKKFENGSNSFLEAFANSGSDIGDIIKIGRTGEKFETKYSIEIIKKAETSEDVANNLPGDKIPPAPAPAPVETPTTEAPLPEDPK